MKVLIGTSNPSKTKLFSEYLSMFNVEFLTLKDLSITAAPDECGRDPKENAMIKARFYGRYFDRVICNDAGLYFLDLPMDDERQPGLFIRRTNGERPLNDDEMIEYYSSLIHSIGGKVLASYFNGFAVYNCGNVYSFADSPEKLRETAFYMVDTPSDKRNIGWPLDSLSINKNTLRYFTDSRNDIPYNDIESSVVGDNTHRFVDFLKRSLGL